MANTLLLKRSAVQGKAPTTTDLALGELGINTYDGKVYIKKDDGTPAIVEIGSKTGLASSGSNTDITSLTGITGGIATADYVTFDTGITSVPATGRLTWDTDNGTLQLGLVGGNVNLQLGQEELIRVHNGTGSALTDGQLVYINGSSGNRPTVALASNSSESTSSVTMGMVTESIANGSEGFVTVSGIVNNLNTLAYNAGDALWLGSTAGTFTTTKPTAPNHAVLVGYVVRSHASIGSVLVKIQNGYELNELHNVLITSVANNDILKYDSTTSVWKNTSVVPLVNTTQSVSYAANATIDWSIATTTRITLTGNIVITNTGAVDGQKLILELIQDNVGGRTISFTSETRFGTDITSVTLSTTANKIDRVGLIYNSSANKYDVVAVVKGY